MAFFFFSSPIAPSRVRCGAVLDVATVHILGLQKHTLLTEHSDAVSALAVVNGKLVSGSWDTNIKASFCWTAMSDHGELLLEIGMPCELAVKLPFGGKGLKEPVP